MDDDEDDGEGRAGKVAEREAERLRRRQRARHTFDEAFRLWARTGADEDEDKTVALQREAAAVQAAVPVAWAVQEHCSGPEALALGVLIRAMEDALAGSLWASLTPAGGCGRPHSQMERAAQEAAIACMAHADAGLLTIKLSMAKNNISETYGINIGTVHKWWRDAKASGAIYDVPLTSFEGLTPPRWMSEGERGRRTSKSS